MLERLLDGDANQLLGAESIERLQAELDRFSAYGYGQASQRRWLQAPSPALAGLSPLEALAGAEGNDLLVLAEIRRQLQTLENSR